MKLQIDFADDVALEDVIVIVEEFVDTNGHLFEDVKFEG